MLDECRPHLLPSIRPLMSDPGGYVLLPRFIKFMEVGCGLPKLFISKSICSLWFKIIIRKPSFFLIVLLKYRFEQIRGNWLEPWRASTYQYPNSIIEWHAYFSIRRFGQTTHSTRYAFRPWGLFGYATTDCHFGRSPKPSPILCS